MFSMLKVRSNHLEDDEEIQYGDYIGRYVQSECSILSNIEGDYIFIASINAHQPGFKPYELLHYVSKLYPNQKGFEGKSVGSAIGFWQKLGAKFGDYGHFVLTFEDLEKYYQNKKAIIE